MKRWFYRKVSSLGQTENHPACAYLSAASLIAVDHVRQLLANRAELLERLSKVHQEAQEKGIEVPPAIAHEWDEPYDGSSDEEGTPGVPLKAEEDDGMWEDE